MGSHSSSSNSQAQYRLFIGVTFTCCNVYGRLNLNTQKNAYQGRCYKCGRPAVVSIEK